MHFDSLVIFLFSAASYNYKAYAQTTVTETSNGLENLIRSFAASLSVYMVQEAFVQQNLCPTVAHASPLVIIPSSSPCTSCSVESSSPSRPAEVSTMQIPSAFSEIAPKLFTSAATTSFESFDQVTDDDSDDTTTITSMIVVATQTITSFRSSTLYPASQTVTPHRRPMRTTHITFTAAVEESMPRTDVASTGTPMAHGLYVEPYSDTPADVSDRLLSLIFAVTSALDDSKVGPTAVHALLDAFDAGLSDKVKHLNHPSGPPPGPASPILAGPLINASYLASSGAVRSTPSQSLQKTTIPGKLLPEVASSALTTDCVKPAKQFTTGFWAKVEKGKSANNQVFATQIANKIVEEHGTSFLHGLTVDDIAKDIANQLNRQVTGSAYLAEASILKSLLSVSRYTSPTVLPHYF